MGGVTVRPASDRDDDFRRACRRDRLVVATPIPHPTSGAPHRFWIYQGPPLPSPPPCPTPYVSPEVMDEERRVSAAAMSARVQRETEEYLRPLLEIAASSAAAPRPVSPPRSSEDHYDLAKWGRRLSRWN